MHAAATAIRGNPNLLQSEPTHLDFQTFAKDVHIKVHPVIKQKQPSRPRYPNNPWKMCKVPQEAMTKDPEQADLSDKIKIAINGFGKIGRLLAEVALQSVDVELVAINDHSINSSGMVRVWKNSNIDVTVNDYQTLLFRKTYYKIFGEKVRSCDLLEEKAVTVFHIREHNKIPWDETGAEFVVESAGVFNDDKDTSHFKVNDRHKPGTGIVSDSKSVVNCLIYLPKVIYAFGLILNRPVRRAHLNTENEETSSRTASLNIVTRSTGAAKALRKLFPEWNGDPISMLFEADAAAVHMSDVDLTFTLEESVKCRDTDDATASNRLCGAEAGVHLAAILSFCVDMIRCVPVSGCRLELL